MRRATAVLTVTVLLVAGLPVGGFAGEGGRVGRIESDLVLVSSLDAREELVEAAGLPVGGSASASHDPRKVFLASLAIPGAGQLLQGQKRGYLYLLAELALVGSFFALEQKGSDARDRYEEFANEHWDYDAFIDWYNDVCADCDTCGYQCRPVAEYGTQEYYEDIGKYDTYWRWWYEDNNEEWIPWDQPSTMDLLYRDLYWGIRQDSNRHLRHARYAITAAFLNHIVSALDSFFSARGSQSDEGESTGDLGLEFDVAEGGDGLRCALTTRY